jgi:hypothetical protein
LLAPFNQMLDIIPFIGSAGRFLTGLLMAPVAFVISTVVIVIAIVAHSPILLVLTLALIIGGGIFYVRNRKKAKVDQPPQAAPVGAFAAAGASPGFGPGPTGFGPGGNAGGYGPPGGGGGYGPPPGGGGGYGPPPGGYGPPR